MFRQHIEDFRIDFVKINSKVGLVGVGLVVLVPVGWMDLMNYCLELV